MSFAFGIASLAACPAASQSIGAPHGGDAGSLLAQGDYVGAKRKARMVIEARAAEGSAAAEAVVEASLLSADANELLEGAAEETRADLDMALQAATGRPDESLVRIRAAEIEGRRLLRIGEPLAAAEALIKAQMALLGMKPRPVEEQLRLWDAYGRVTLALHQKTDAEKAFLEAYSVREKMLSDGHPDKLTSIHNLGLVMLSSGNLDGALEGFREVSRIRATVLGKDHPETLASRRMVAATLERKGDHKAALAERQAVLLLVQGRRAAAGALIAEALTNVANSQFAIGDLDAALETARRAYEASLKADPPVGRVIAEAGSALSKYLSLAGSYGDAMATAQEALAQSGVPAHTPPAVALELVRASAYDALGRSSEAEALYRQLLDRYTASVLLTGGGRATILNNLAALLAKTGRLDEATGLQREALALRTKVLGPDDPLTLASLSSLAAFLNQGGNAARALEIHQQLLARRRAAAGLNPIVLARTLHNLGSTLEQAGDPPSGRKLLEEALDIRGRLLGETHPETIVAMRQLAGLMFTAGDLAGSERLFERAVEALERRRLEVASSGASRQSYFRDVVATYKMLAIIKAQSGNSISALIYADLAKARGLADAAGSRELANGLLSAQDFNELKAAEQALATLLTQDLGEVARDAKVAHSARVDSASTKLERIREKLTRKDPRLLFTSTAGPLTPADLRKTIPSDGAFIQFILLGDKVQLLWLTADGASGASPLLTIPAFGETIKAYLAALGEPVANISPGTAALDRRVFAWPDGSFRLLSISADIPAEADIISEATPVGAAISAALLNALPPKIRALPRWIISPDAFLATIPFDSLPLDGKPLLESKRITYAPSLRMLNLLESRQTSYASLNREPMLLVGDPAYQSATGAPAVSQWTELQGSGSEVEALRLAFGLEANESLYARERASEMVVRELDRRGRLRDYKTIIFSAHGVVDPAVPARNAIVLFGDGASAQSDGYLRAGELMTLNLRSDLVLVSACESGVGAWLEGEGAMGLPYALFVAGSAATILSHWPISDKSSAAFVARLFAKIRNGAAPAAALHETKLDFHRGLEGDSRRNPAHWAAFSYYGPVVAERRTPTPARRATSR